MVWLGEDHNQGNFEENDTERAAYTNMVVNSYESVDCGDGWDSYWYGGDEMVEVLKREEDE